MSIFEIIYRSIKRVRAFFLKFIHRIVTRIILLGNGVEHGSFFTKGVPYFMIARKGHCTIGEGFCTNNSNEGNPIGRNARCVFFVDKNAELQIGNQVGVSSTIIVARIKVVIGDHVKIGGGTCIYDTDFHSLNFLDRHNSKADRANTISKPVIIGNNVFIGAYSTILKGITIGDNVIIGACSVVTKSIPANQLWAGNPAKFIRNV